MDKIEKIEIIKAENLSSGYGGKKVWQEASFNVKRGQFVGILGPNGVGKTTLFNMILGLMNPISGKLEVFGKKPLRGNPRIGYIPQRRPVDNEMKIEVMEIVRLGLMKNYWNCFSFRNTRAEKKKVMETLKSVGAESLASRSIGSLSGGELQRVFLAQALVGDPELILLDEPLTNLDMRREGEMVGLVDSVVRSRGVTVLLIAHNINPLLPFLDEIIYITNGRIAQGNPKEVLTSESLSELYGAPVEVLRDTHGRVAIIGGEEGEHYHDHDN